MLEELGIGWLGGGGGKYLSNMFTQISVEIS